MFKGHFKTGTVEGTGSAINVELGFLPSKVVLYNIDDAGSLWPTLTWVKGMAAASGWLTLAIADNGSSGNTTTTKITTNGISQYTGSAGSAAVGFTIGANANINASNETIVYEAWGEE